MQKMKVGINGFGRIGRHVFRAILDNHSDVLEIVAINELAPAKTSAHLLKYDSTYGIYERSVKAKEHSIIVDEQEIAMFSEREPASINWSSAGVDVVVESSGVFTDANKAKAHLSAGVKKIIISAPGKNEDLTVVMGINDHLYDPQKHTVISNASCTTNCVAPMVYVLHKQFGIRSAFMTTIHAFTNDQSILDKPHKDLRRARTASQSIIPTTTGAAKAVTLALPELKGKIDGMAFRVPTVTGSVTDLVAALKVDTHVEEINAAFKEAERTYLKGILGYTDLPLVSRDYVGNSNSCTIDGLSTMVIGENKLFKVLGWYDNEWGYSSRIADLLKLVAVRQ